MILVNIFFKQAQRHEKIVRELQGKEYFLQKEILNKILNKILIERFTDLKKDKLITFLCWCNKYRPCNPHTILTNLELSNNDKTTYKV